MVAAATECAVLREKKTRSDGSFYGLCGEQID